MNAALHIDIVKFIQALHWVVAVNLLVGCVGVAAFTAWLFADFEPFVSDDVAPSTIESNAEIKLPPSVHNLYAHQEGFQEIFILARFSMAATHLPMFLQTTLCTEPLTPVDPQQQTQVLDLGWWQPMDAQHLQECDGRGENFSQRIMIDTTDPQRYIVYVSTAMQ